NAAFQFSGNDLFVQGNIGSATSVYTNGAFVAGTGSTIYGNGFISKTDGNLTIDASGGFITPSTDLAVSLGSNSLRYNGVFGNVTSTNATTTYLAVTNINSNLISLANNAFDIGTSTKSWRDVYASGTLRVGTSIVVAGSSAVTSTFAAAVSSTQFVANFGSITNPAFTFSGLSRDGVYHTGSAVGISVLGLQVMKIDNGDMTIKGAFYSQINNSVDIGSAGIAWRNIYASGTAYLGNMITGNSTTTNATTTGTFAVNGNVTLGGGSNILLYSEQLDNSSWHVIDAGVTTTANVVSAPVGTTTAEQIDFATTTSYFYQSVTMPTGMAGGDFTFSVWLYSPAKATIGIRLTPQPQSPLGCKAISLTTGWARYYVTVRSLTTDTSFQLGLDNRVGVCGDGLAGTVYAWGAQLTQANQAGSYVQTVATPVFNNLFVNALVNSDLLPATDTVYSIGYNTLRFNGVFGNVTSTNATTTNFYATNATIANINFTNVTSTNLSVTNINGNLIPLANNAFDIGTSTKSWRDVYASGTIHGGYFSASSTTPNSTSYPTYTFEGDTDTGLSYLGANSFGMNIGGATKLYINSSGNVYSTNHFPLSNGSNDLGATNNSWKDIYSSGTLTIAGGSVGRPAILFSSSTNSGIYSPAAQDIRISRAGTTDMAIFNSNGVQFNDHTFAGSNNLYNFGKAGAAWKDVYASGTAYLGNMITGNSTTTNTTSTNLFFTSASGSSLLLNSLTVAN
ncbi:MAG: hypothetical protein AAB386_02185, partial [Patescibacteria group bacterium]